MSINIAINGFGRIGRNVVRALYENARNHDFKLDLNKSELSMIFAVSNEKNILPLKNFLSKLIIGLKPSIKRIDSIYLELIDN